MSHSNNKTSSCPNCNGIPTVLQGGFRRGFECKFSPCLTASPLEVPFNSLQIIASQDHLQGIPTCSPKNVKYPLYRVMLMFDHPLYRVMLQLPHFPGVLQLVSHPLLRGDALLLKLVSHLLLLGDALLLTQLFPQSITRYHEMLRLSALLRDAQLYFSSCQLRVCCSHSVSASQ